MDFELSSDQLALRDAARDLLDRLASPERVRKVVDAGGGYDADLWRAMVEQGWTDPEFVGVVEAAVLLEEVGRHVAPAPFLSQWLAGTDEITAIAWDVNAPALYAPSASAAIVRHGDVMRRVRLATAPPREAAMDRTRELGWLRDVDVADGTEVATAEGFLDRATVAFSAELLGVAARAMEMAVDYAKVREQFGKPIGSFQALKHRFADMYLAVEKASSLAYFAALTIAEDDARRATAPSMAKAAASECQRLVVTDGLQMHGGIGFTWENDLHFWLKRAKTTDFLFGSGPAHRAYLAKEMGLIPVSAGGRAS